MVISDLNQEGKHLAGVSNKIFSKLSHAQWRSREIPALWKKKPENQSKVEHP